MANEEVAMRALKARYVVWGHWNWGAGGGCHDQ